MNVSRRTFMALGGCAVGSILLPPSAVRAASASSAAEADMDSAEVSRLFREFGATRTMPARLDAWLKDPVRQKRAPYQVFDNIWQVGLTWVSSWAVSTEEGWVLIDTTHEPFVDFLLENLKTVGIPPESVRLVLMTHGHFDHVGGYHRLKPLLKNARFAMTERGWAEAARYAAASQGTPSAWIMPEGKDLVVRDGEALICGGSRFTVLETPGHTWGTASYMYEARRGNRCWNAVTVGGQGLNAIEGPEQVRAYIESMKRLGEERLGIAVDLTAHPFSTGLTEQIPAIQALKPSDPHPLVNRAAYLARLDRLIAGASARLQKELQAAAR